MSDPDSTAVYLNKSLTDLPGEVWKDVPGFEGYYQASSFGRVKSLDRTIPHPRLKSQFVKRRILSQSVHENKNLLTSDSMVDLRITLLLENKYHYFNTRRLIYRTFIDPLLDYQSIKEFRNITEASKITNQAEKSISEVAKGINKQWNGFVWKMIKKIII